MHSTYIEALNRLKIIQNSEGYTCDLRNSLQLSICTKLEEARLDKNASKRHLSTALLCPELALREALGRMKSQPNASHGAFFDGVAFAAGHSGACVARSEAVHVHLGLTFGAHFTSQNAHVPIHCHFGNAVAGRPSSVGPSSWSLARLQLSQK
jgi:hypothetical protein